MGLITRCPACGTMFKVVADQLKISEGWVRCGHCTEIFDATADLRDESEIDLPRVTKTDERGPIHASSPAPTEPSPLESESESDSGGSSYPSVQSEVPASELGGAPDSMEFDEQLHDLQHQPLDDPFEFRRDDIAEPAQSEPAESEPELHDLSFVRQARQREFWRKPAMRATLVLVALVLVALLAAQYAYQDRDRLSAMYPQARPWIARACDVLHCRIGPPHVIDAVAIETSSFNKLRGDTYRLNVTLKNTAITPVAMPSLELTLTDSQDQPVLRRVLQPGDFAPGAVAINAASDSPASIVIAVNAAAGASRVAGYRVLAFYP